MRQVLSYLKHYRREAVLGPFFKLIEAMFDLFVPLVVAAIIDQGIGAGDRGYVFRASGILVLLAFFGLVFAILAQYFAARAAVGFSANTIPPRSSCESCDSPTSKDG